METMYYSLNARKVKVSGGADLLTFVPTPMEAPAVQAAQILDFDRCRRRLETKAAWKELSSAAGEEETVEEPAPQPRRERRDRLGGILELAASAAVLLVSVAAALAFFSLL